MSQLLSLVVNGLSLGSIYALIALGMVLVYKAGSVVNFAHPSLLVLGTLVVTTLHQGAGWPFALAAPAGILAGALAGVLLERSTVSWLVRRRAVVAAGILTIGLSIIIDTLTADQIGAGITTTGDPWGAGTVRIFGDDVPTSRVAALLVALVLLLGLQVWLRRSDVGVQMRAASDDPETAQLMGVRLRRVSTTAWAIASGLAVVAGIFLVSYPSAGLDVTIGAAAIQAVPAVVIGGIDSITGAVVGGLVVGLTQTLALGYQSQLSFLGGSFSSAVPYLVMLLVLLVRPAGLFGSKEIARV